MKEPNFFPPRTEPFFFPGNDVGIICMHGFTASPKEVRELGEYLHETFGYTIVGLRLPGHVTDPADMNRMRWQDWLNVIKDAYVMLHPHVKQIFIVGFSLGGALSLRFAAQYPVSGVVALSAPHHVPQTYFPYIRHFIPWLYFLRPFSQKKQGDWFNPAAKSGRYSYAVNPLRAALEVDRLTRDLGVWLEEKGISAPTLMLYSEDDPYISIDHLHAYQQVLPNAKTITIRERNHHILEDGDTTVVFKFVADFISTLIQP